jgi:uncharacterized protein (DUF433 family)
VKPNQRDDSYAEKDHTAKNPNSPERTVTVKGAPAWHGRITSRPDVLAGKPCIAGTRVSVEAVLDTLSVTGSIAETAAAFPRVIEADVPAAEP